MMMFMLLADFQHVSGSEGCFDFFHTQQHKIIKSSLFTFFNLDSSQMICGFAGQCVVVETA